MYLSPILIQNKSIKTTNQPNHPPNTTMPTAPRPSAIKRVRFADQVKRVRFVDQIKKQVNRTVDKKQVNRTVDGIPSISFNARGLMETRILSNLSTVKESLMLDDTGFGSVEAAYVCIYKFDGMYRNIFDVNGVLGSFKAYNQFVATNPRAALAVKVDSWKNAVGILAKVGGGPSDAAKRLRSELGMSEPAVEEFNAEKDEPLWRMLHMAKWNASPEFQKCLLQTQGKYLYEFDRSNGRIGKPESVWGGCFLPDGKFRGKNVMGKMLMDLRHKQFA